MAGQSKKNPPRKPQPAPHSAAVPASQPWYADFRLQATVLALIAFLFYGNTFFNEMAFDDDIVIVHNEYVLEGLKGLPGIFTKDGYDSYYRQFNSGNQLTGGRYRPLSLATFAVEQQFFGAISPGRVDSVMHSGMLQQQDPYHDQLIRDMHVRHLLNVFWYALSVIVLLYFLRNVVFKGNGLMAFVAALLFTIHPIHTEVVANVKSRDELLSLLFICLTLLLASRYRAAKKPIVLAGALACYFLALLSKEYAITLLVLLPLTFYLFDGYELKKSLRASAPYFAVALVYILIRAGIAQPAVDSNSADILNNPYAFATGAEKIATELSTSLRYVQLLVFPYPLSFDYSYNQVPYQNFTSPAVWLSIAFYIALAGAWIILIKKRHVLSFGIAFYLLNLMLIGNFFFDIGATMGERLIFHSSAGFAIIAAYALVRGTAYLRPQKAGIASLAAVLSVITILAAAETIARNRDWKNNITLSTHDLTTSPNSVLVNTNVAIALMNGSDAINDTARKNADLRRAVSLFTKAISIYSAYDKAYLNRSLAYFRLGMLDSVLADLGRARKYNPTHPQFADIYFNLGIAFANTGQLDKADTAWAATLAVNPGYTNAQSALSSLRSERMKNAGH